jgi:hypothetical protein
MAVEVTLFGEEPSAETVRLRRALELLGVRYRFVRTGSEEARGASSEERTRPAVEVKNGSASRTLGAPNETALAVVLRRLGVHCAG